METAAAIRRPSPSATEVRRLVISGNLGPNSFIFPDPNGGLDVTQTINWVVMNELVSLPGWVATNFHMMSLLPQGEVTLSVSGRLTFVVQTTQQVPDPGALTLTGLGLVAMAAARQRRRQQPLQPANRLR